MLYDMIWYDIWCNICHTIYDMKYDMKWNIWQVTISGMMYMLWYIWYGTWYCICYKIIDMWCGMVWYDTSFGMMYYPRSWRSFSKEVRLIVLIKYLKKFFDCMFFHYWDYCGSRVYESGHYTSLCEIIGRTCRLLRHTALMSDLGSFPWGKF